MSSCGIVYHIFRFDTIGNFVKIEIFLYNKKTAENRGFLFSFSDISTLSVSGRTNLAFFNALFDDRLGDGSGNRLVLLEDHRERAAALCNRTDRVRVTEHFAERDGSLEELDACAVFHALNAAATLVDRAVRGTHILLGNYDFDVHHRLEEFRLSLEEGLLEALAGALDEREFVGVDFVVGTEVNGSLDVDDGEARERTGLESLLDALLDGRNVLGRNYAALDLVDELKALAGFLRFELKADVSVLTATAGLLDVLVLVVDVHLDRLAVSDLRSAYIAVDVEFAFQTVDDNFEVELAHTGDDRLGSFLVESDDEGRVFHRQSVESDAELLVVPAALRLDGNRDNGSGEVDRLENDRLFGIAKRIARTGLGKTDTRDDISGAGLFERLLLIGVHAEETGNALLLTDRGVEEFGAELHRTRVNADERNLAHVLIGHDLERETAERLVVGNLALLLGIVLRDGRTRVERRRKVIANGVEERLNALILERAAAESGSNRTGEAALADSLLDLVDRELLTCEELLQRYGSDARSAQGQPRADGYSDRRGRVFRGRYRPY